MSPIKNILKTLTEAHETQGPDTFTRPTDIPGFSQKPADYQKAVNELLKDRLIEGKPDDEGRMTIAVNPHRVGDVRKRIRPAWANPTLWLAASVVLVAVAGVVGL